MIIMWAGSMENGFTPSYITATQHLNIPGTNTAVTFLMTDPQSVSSILCTLIIINS